MLAAGRRYALRVARPGRRGLCVDEGVTLSAFLTDHGVLVALLCAAAAVVYGVVLTWRLLALSEGNEEMRKVAAAIQEGAAAYLKRQYTTIFLVALVIA